MGRKSLARQFWKSWKHFKVKCKIHLTVWADNPRAVSCFVMTTRTGTVSTLSGVFAVLDGPERGVSTVQSMLKNISFFWRSKGDQDGVLLTKIENYFPTTSKNIIVKSAPCAPNQDVWKAHTQGKTTYQGRPHTPTTAPPMCPYFPTVYHALPYVRCFRHIS